MAFAINIPGSEGAIGRSVRTFWHGILARAVRRHAYRRTLLELQSLTDNELADIGIHRSMISEIARQSAYGVSDAPHAA